MSTNRNLITQARVAVNNTGIKAKESVMPKIRTVHGIENRKVVSQKEWLAARKILLVKANCHTPSSGEA